LLQSRVTGVDLPQVIEKFWHYRPTDEPQSGERAMSYPALTLGATPATLIVSGPWTAAQSASLEQLVATSPLIDARRANVLEKALSS
jgi:hypothetical protein